MPRTIASRKFRVVIGREALREGAVIVFSVLLALAVDSWWEERGHRAQERSYLVAVSAELDSLHSVIDTAIEADSAHAEATAVVLQLLYDDQLAPESVPSISTLVPLGYSVFDPPTGTLQILTTSDQASLIRSEEVRAALQSTRGELERTEVALNRTESEVWTLLQQYHKVIQTLWDSNGRRPAGGPISIEESRLPLKLLRLSPELRGIYEHQAIVLRNRVFYLKALRGRIERARGLLE